MNACLVKRSSYLESKSWRLEEVTENVERGITKLKVEQSDVNEYFPQGETFLWILIVTVQTGQGQI